MKDDFFWASSDIWMHQNPQLTSNTLKRLAFPIVLKISSSVGVDMTLSESQHWVHDSRNKKDEHQPSLSPTLEVSTIRLCHKH